jgi:hypothetical protein
VTQKDEVSRMNDEVIRTMMLKPLDESMEKKKYLKLEGEERSPRLRSQDI